MTKDIAQLQEQFEQIIGLWAEKRGLAKIREGIDKGDIQDLAKRLVRFVVVPE